MFAIAVFRRSIGESGAYRHDVELVPPPDDDHVCKVHQTPNGEYGYTHVWEVRNTQLPIGLHTPIYRPDGTLGDIRSTQVQGVNLC